MLALLPQYCSKQVREGGRGGEGREGEGRGGGRREGGREGREEGREGEREGRREGRREGGSGCMLHVHVHVGRALD